MVPFVLLRTPTLTVKVKHTRPVGGFPEQLKGVLAIIQPIKKGEYQAITVQLVTASTAATWIANGQRPSGDLLLLKKNSVTPVHLPDLSDLALLPLALKIAIQKKLKEEGGVQGIELEHVILECIANIVDSPSILPTVMETCNLNARRHRMEINSYSDDLKIFTTSSTLRLNEVCACWEWLSANPLDERKVTLDFNIVKCQNNLRGARVLVWNCRDVSRSSFLPQFQHMLDRHMPDLVVLTETRSSVRMGRFICSEVNIYKSTGRSVYGVIGGVLFVILSKHLTIENYLEDYSMNVWNVIT